MSTENERAGWGAILAAGAGLSAVVAILVLANQEAATVRPEDAPRAARESTRRSGHLSSMPIGDPNSPAGTRARSASADAGVGPEGGVPSLAAELEPMPHSVTLPSGLPAVSVTPLGTPAGAATGPVELTPEQRYEAHAFLVDLVALRIDTLRTEVAEARTRGDATRLRRLEPALSVLEEEIVSLEARSRELERALGRHREATEDEPTEDEPTEDEAPEESE